MPSIIISTFTYLCYTAESMRDPHSDDEEDSYGYWTLNDVFQTIDEHQKFIKIRWELGKF